MITFKGDEKGYFDWLKRNRSGFVINIQRSLNPADVKLHSAMCQHIGSRSGGPYTTRQYIKVCSLDRRELIDWARDDVGGEPSNGCYCLTY